MTDAHLKHYLVYIVRKYKTEYSAWTDSVILQGLLKLRAARSSDVCVSGESVDAFWVFMGDKVKGQPTTTHSK